MPQSLSAGQVSSLSKTGVHRVDHGLYLQVRDNGARSWLLRFQLNGKARAMGLGPLRLVPLTEARAKAIRAQKLLLDGKDPIEIRRTERKAAQEPDVLTFSTCSARYIEAHRAGWRNAKHEYQWAQSLATYADPTIGNLPVSAITVEHVFDILEPIWATKSETAKRLRGRIERVLGWAEARGFREGINPAMWKGPLGHMLPPVSSVQKIEHHKAVPYAEIPGLFKEIAAREGNSARALRFVILTAARSGEARGTTWGEIDLKEGAWTIPGDRMKMGKEHRVPLSAHTLALLPKKADEDKDTTLVFPGTRPGKGLSDMSLIQVMRKLRGKGSTVHGLRSSFRDWAADKTDYPREVIEAALAHQVGNEVERAYFRSDLFDKRRALMSEWAKFVTGAKK